MAKILTVLLLLICISVSAQQKENWIQRTDISILRNINYNPSENFQVWEEVSSSSLTLSFAMPLALYAVGCKKKDTLLRRQCLYMAGASLGNIIWSTVFKNAAHRQRPGQRYPDLNAYRP